MNSRQLLGARIIGMLFAAAFIVADSSCWGAGPVLTDIRPAGAQRGTDVTVTLTGQRLGDIKDLFFYDPGIQLVRFSTNKTNSVSAHLKISNDARLGEHLLRARTATGITETRIFSVGPFPEFDEQEPNSEIGRAQKAPLNSTVNGLVGTEDEDFYRVELRRGDVFTAEVEAMRLGRTIMDPRLTIMEANGTVLAMNDDNVLLKQDSVVTFTAPHDGTFVVQLREATLSGAATPYRLHMGTFPRPMSVFPPGGQTGRGVSFELTDTAGRKFPLSESLPQTAVDRFPLFTTRGGLSAPSANWIRVSPFPDITGDGSNTSRESAPVASANAPFAFNGRLANAGDAAYFKFFAERGKALEVSVYGRRLRSPIDPVLDVLNMKGEVLTSNDDGAGVDAAVRFVPPYETNYFLRVTDQLKRGGPAYVFRAEITPSEPSLTLTMPPAARNDSQTRQYAAVPRGGRVATLLAVRRQNVDGALTLEAANLPPGVTMKTAAFGPRQDQTVAVFEATPDADLVGTLADVFIRSTNGVTAGFRNDLEFLYGPNNTAYYATRSERFPVAVTEASPYSLRIVESKSPLVQGGTLDLRIVANRKAGFDEPINLKMLWNPPGISSQPEMTIPKGQTWIIYQVSANAGAELKAWKIAILGTATVEGGPLHVSTQLAPLEVAEPFLLGKVDTVATEPGKTVKIVCKLEHKRPLPAGAKLRLLGLPEKLGAPSLALTKDQPEAVFEMKIPEDLAPASFRQLSCVLEANVDGDLLRQTVSNAGTLRIVPAKKTLADAGAPTKQAKAK